VILGAKHLDVVGGLAKTTRDDAKKAKGNRCGGVGDGGVGTGEVLRRGRREVEGACEGASVGKLLARDGVVANPRQEALARPEPLTMKALVGEHLV